MIGDARYHGKRYGNDYDGDCNYNNNNDYNNNDYNNNDYNNNCNNKLQLPTTA